jgi:hypothetical protein
MGGVRASPLLRHFCKWVSGDESTAVRAVETKMALFNNLETIAPLEIYGS